MNRSGILIFLAAALAALVLHCRSLAHPGCPESRPDMACIPAGSFLRGSERESIDEDSRRRVRDESPVEQIYLSAFYMDIYEVTASDYDECVAAGSCSYAKTNYKGYSEPRMPKLGISWFQARDYCLWKGKRLPTEAEWEKAARGDVGHPYPWGDEPATCQRAIIKEGGRKGCGTGKTWDVGSRPVGRYGLYDMAGNSWEWVQDWYSKSYGACGASCSGRDPRGPCGGADSCPGAIYRVVRGGSWWWDAESALSSNRRPHFPANKPYHHFGFRCARDA